MQYQVTTDDLRRAIEAAMASGGNTQNRSSGSRASMPEIRAIPPSSALRARPSAFSRFVNSIWGKIAAVALACWTTWNVLENKDAAENKKSAHEPGSNGGGVEHFEPVRQTRVSYDFYEFDRVPVRRQQPAPQIRYEQPVHVQEPAPQPPAPVRRVVQQPVRVQQPVSQPSKPVRRVVQTPVQAEQPAVIYVQTPEPEQGLIDRFEHGLRTVTRVANATADAGDAVADAYGAVEGIRTAGTRARNTRSKLHSEAERRRLENERLALQNARYAQRTREEAQRLRDSQIRAEQRRVEAARKAAQQERQAAERRAEQARKEAQRAADKRAREIERYNKAHTQPPRRR